MKPRSELADALRAPLERSAAERVHARVLATRRAPRRKRPIIVWAAVLTAAAAAAVVTVLSWPAAPQPFLVDGAPLRDLHALDASRSLALDDGTTLRLGARTEVRVVANHAHEVVLDLAQGTMELDVRTSPGRRVVVDAGLVSVEVVGTRFTVTRTSELVRVQVTRGRVDVRGERVPGRLRRLMAGERIEIRRPVEPDDPAPRAHDPQAPRPPEPAAPEAPVQRQPATRSRARREHVEPAASEPLDAPTVQDLFDEADSARRAGRPREAVEALARIVDEHPQDPRAGVAALSRARIELDVLDDPRQARRSLELALALGLPSALEEDARARRVEALARGGEPDRAREAALAFFARWPDSRHRTLVARFGGLETP